MMGKANRPDVEPTLRDNRQEENGTAVSRTARRDVLQRIPATGPGVAEYLACRDTGWEPARDATGLRSLRTHRGEVQQDPLGCFRPPATRSLCLSPAPLAQHIPPGLNPSRSSSSSPHHPGLSGWSCSPGPGQSPPSIIHARAAPPPRPPRRSEAERSGLCCAGRAPPPPARCPRSTGECCGRGGGTGGGVPGSSSGAVEGSRRG